MKSKKTTAGILLMMIAFIATVTFSVIDHFSNTKKVAELEKNNVCTEHLQTIERLQNEIAVLENIEHGQNDNSADIVGEKARFFLQTFYCSPKQAEDVRPLMTTTAYNNLYEKVDQGGAGIGTNENYQVSITDEQAYYTQTGEAAADVLIMATLNVRTPAGGTSTPLIFQAEMVYQNDTWLVSKILKNSTVRYQ